MRRLSRERPLLVGEHGALSSSKFDTHQLNRYGRERIGLTNRLETARWCEPPGISIQHPRSVDAGNKAGKFRHRFGRCNRLTQLPSFSPTQLRFADDFTRCSELLLRVDARPLLPWADSFCVGLSTTRKSATSHVNGGVLRRSSYRCSRSRALDDSRRSRSRRSHESFTGRSVMVF